MKPSVLPLPDSPKKPRALPAASSFSPRPSPVSALPRSWLLPASIYPAAIRRACAKSERTGSQAASACRLCRHRREGQTGGDLGARQGRRRLRKPMVSARTMCLRGCVNSSGVSECRMPRMARKVCRAGRGRNVITGQGSGFFISADGYAVTNNHVVEKAESVQVTTDDGKTP